MASNHVTSSLQVGSRFFPVFVGYWENPSPKLTKDMLSKEKKVYNERASITFQVSFCKDELGPKFCDWLNTNN